jgi:hypothetical protein
MRVSLSMASSCWQSRTEVDSVLANVPTVPAAANGRAQTRTLCCGLKSLKLFAEVDVGGRRRTDANTGVVPLAGIEPALLAELDFESSASTSSATGAFGPSAVKAGVAKPPEYSGRQLPVNPQAQLRKVCRRDADQALTTGRGRR